MLRAPFLFLAVSLSMVCALASTADAQVLRYSTTASGKIVGTGNTLGLSKATGENGPGTRDSIGTFISLTGSVDDMPANPSNPWPANTTYDWTQNGSSAQLSLPVEGEVLYAELVWGGSSNYVTDVTSQLDTPVTLTANSTSISVSPSAQTPLTIATTGATGFAANYYMRSADVTSFVAGAGSGTYAVSGVPATEATAINSLNAAGWTLVVVIHDSSEPVRNLSVFVGGSFVDEDSQQDYTVNGFCTPPAGAFQAHVVTSAIEGDANLTGDQLLIAQTAAGPFANLSGPNNPADNFFCSQINDENGQLDMAGSFGNVNHDAQNGVNVAGGRQSWDVTTVGLSSTTGQLVNGQTSAVLRTITTGDSYVPTLAALAIDVNAPDFTGGSSALESSVDHVALGDSLQVTLTLQNGGQVTASDVVLHLPLDAGLTLDGYTTDGQSGDFQGNPVDAADLAAGVDAGDLAAGETRTVVLDLTVSGAPAGTNFALQSTWSYAFQVCANGATLSENFVQFGVVDFDAPPSTTSTTGSTSTGGGVGSTTGSDANSTATGLMASSTGNGNGAGGGGNEGGGGPGSLVDGKGCSCELGDRDAGPAGGFWALLVGLGLAGWRRRRAA